MANTKLLDEYSLFELYFKLVEDSEAPLLYHRWCFISTLAALLGRNFYLPFGNDEIYPNMYTMLIGSPGARKSTAIKAGKRLLAEVGYETFVADRTTKEKFMVDLHHGIGTDIHEANGKEKDIASQILFKELEDNLSAREAYIVADEFNDFIGHGNLDFLSFLGNLWDYKGIYKNRIKNGTSVAIPNPTINILGGNTATGFANAFPPEAIGQGFLSRLLLIYGEPSSKRITFPKRGSQELHESIVEGLKQIKQKVNGPAKLTTEAEKLLDDIYQNTTELTDVRFRTYSTRRFTHLLKLCLVCAGSRCDKSISFNDVFLSNTILSYTESLMPRALGEFGKSKYSDTATKIIELLGNSSEPIETLDLWKLVANDFDKMSDFGALLGRLREADKIMSMGKGIILKRGALKEGGKYYDFKLLKEAKDKV